MVKTPIYRHSGTYAQEHDELKKYFASHNAHMACKEAIGQAIADHHRNHLPNSSCFPGQTIISLNVTDQFSAVIL